MKYNLGYLFDLLVVITNKDLKVRYKSSMLGYLWSVANPLLFAMIYYFIFKLVMRVQIPNYTVFLITRTVRSTDDPGGRSNPVRHPATGAGRWPGGRNGGDRLLQCRSHHSRDVMLTPLTLRAWSRIPDAHRCKKWDTSCHHCKFRKARFAWAIQRP